MRSIFPHFTLLCLLAGCSGPAPRPDAALPDAPDGDIPPAPPDADAPPMDVSAMDAPPTADVSCGAESQPCCPSGSPAPRCASGLSCRADGTCRACAEGLTACGELCVDSATSSAHCGGCGRACGAGEQCVGGACRVVCAAPATECAGACVRTLSDAAHCGGCGRACALVHAVAACEGGGCAVAACDANFGDCDGDAANGCETDLTSSTGHCGTCGRACPATTAGTASCAMGTCALTCPPNLADCDGDRANGCETDLRVNPEHCARCDNACPAPTGSAAACTAGVCGRSECAVGRADCDGSAVNGCEVDTATSATHCGQCGRACALANATAACVGGGCVIARCNDAYGDCDGDAANGCETSLRTSLTHCGACGVACSTANGVVPSCAAGRCGIASCVPGRGNCDGNAANGCETDTTSAALHCGACGRACALPNAGATCAGGTCALGACTGAFGNCDGNAANGCETDTARSVAHCGGCGRACALPHAATQSCAGGLCALGTCEAGWGNCDGSAANGCETDTTSSASHCGACGRACAAGQVCSSGACVLSCAAGQTNCAGACVNLLSDVGHCGACTTVCDVANAAPACDVGVCRVGSCRPNYGNCNRMPADGCETNLLTSPANCGACGRACSLFRATAACAGGVCRVGTCEVGWGNCDGDDANGCETDLTNSLSHCGACGAACRPLNGTGVCTAGVCRIASCLNISLSGIHFRDCNNDVRDGCEVETSGDVNNCGGCGRVCALFPHAAGTVCSLGTCGYGSCNSDYRDCNGTVSDGCEINVATDEHHCGSCIRACGLANTCRSGRCL